MARKKVTKRATKKRVSTTQVSSLQQFEKTLIELPAKMAALAEKSLKALKQKETKLKSAVQKATQQLKATETKLKTATQSKQSTAGKKQLNMAKKLLAEATAIYRVLTKELHEVTSAVAQAANKLAKCTSLRKFLTQFEKEWSKQTKATKTKPKTKRRSTKKTASHNSQNTEQSNVEKFNTSVENVNMDEESEMIA